MLTQEDIRRRLGAAKVREIAGEKDPGSIPKSVVGATDNIVEDPSKAQLIGSYTYKTNYYPGDIDIHEILEETEENAATIYLQMVGILQREVARIQHKKDVFFSEVKAGTDNRYDLDCRDPQFYQKLRAGFKNQLFTDEEFAALEKLYKRYRGYHDKDAKDELEEEIRKFKTIKWTADEIHNGEKEIRGLTITLEEAIAMPGTIKIDIFAPINGRYTELSTLWYLVIHDKDTHDVRVINYPEFPNYVEEMQGEIKKYFSPTFWSPFKAAKRMWSLARFVEDIPILKALTPIQQSSIARMSQIRAEAEAIIGIFERYSPKKVQPALRSIQQQIDEWRGRLGNIDIELPEDFFRLIFDTARKPSIRTLTAISDIIKEIIDEHALAFLKENRLYPPPERLLNLRQPAESPEKMSYFRKALKLPDSMPIDT